MSLKIVVEARVREVMESSNHGVNRLADGALDELNRRVEDLIRNACLRAKENGRSGLKSIDF